MITGTRHPITTRILRGVIALFIGLTCLQVWIGADGLLEPARAQIPDSGLQRKLLLEEARRTNQLLAEIAKTLRDSTLNVRVVAADDRTGAPARIPGRP